MMTRPGKEASKAFRPRAREIPWIDLGRTRGSKPRMARTIGVPFWINPRDDSVIADNIKTKEVKPSIADRICPFFEAGTPKSIGDFMISLIMTKVGGAGVVLHRRSRKYSSQSCLYPIDIALWLVPICVLEGHWLATMQSLLHTTSLSIQIIPRSARL